MEELRIGPDNKPLPPFVPQLRRMPVFGDEKAEIDCVWPTLEDLKGVNLRKQYKLQEVRCEIIHGSCYEL